MHIEPVPKVTQIHHGNPEHIWTLLQPGEWVTLLDLIDAYLYILIHPRHRHYPSNPFDLAPVPNVFTQVV